MNFIHRAFLSAISLSILLAAILFSTCARAESEDSTFLQRLKTIIVQSHGDLHREGASGTLKAIFNTKFPVTRPALNRILIDALKQKLASYKDIKIISAKEFGESYEGQFQLNRSQIFLHADFALWDSADFAPKLEHNVVALLIKMKVAVAADPPCEVEKGNHTKFKIAEREFPVILFSVSSDISNLDAQIKTAFESFIEDYILS